MITAPSTLCARTSRLLKHTLPLLTPRHSVFVYEEALRGRNLLQAKKGCPVNFEIQNYTIITSQCKGPEYAPKQCCNALLQFACPYAADINDVATDCADAMFSYINLYGKYPPGLFANECRGDKLGLRCNETAPATAAEASDHGGCRSPLLLALVAFLIPVML
ncbi:unnamed protein product [Cuscuta campestris]|uniref:GPI-anchored protein LLG1-like domain-containing protein n=1 Tax=Cuscuta campestris TaxID=132261 RepID=A0A484MVA4_9ASTE|nr:unnamed protein product [Cuscuta campestris]